MRTGVIGITGRIGTILSKMIATEDFAGGVSSKTTDVEIENIVKNSDVLVDFSAPKATLKILPFAKKYNVPLVTGTTGFSEDEFEELKSYAKHISILHANNFSVCVQLMAMLLRKCSEVLMDFDFSIVDKHHKRKKDAPSGTALFLAKQVTSKAQIVSIRSGNICGDHICDFSGENEMLTISHRAFNRNIFASGALDCAKWIIGKNAGLYTMEDFLRSKIQ
ncbi:MAG: 4-hydroxy-tetrahydrodipicolinate reductase [Alphaproteobacteria bacterium]|nr:4-hydroxy-tetrahydrodipicolinate reductase [Alphaproteobacteria bacterium]